MDTIDSILEEFDPSATHEHTQERYPVTVWVPREYKEKYDHIQVVSKKSFSKMLRQIIMKSIDKVEMKSAS